MGDSVPQRLAVGAGDIASVDVVLDGDRASVVEVEPDSEAVYESLLSQGLTDGLPVIPPTRDRVDRMLEHAEGDPDEPIGRVPPTEGVATLRNVAVNAVMAGCRPDYFPVVLACLEAALDPRANLRAALTTTYVSWPSFVVNG